MAKFVGTARSTVAPFGTRPELGTFKAMREPSLPETPKPLTTRLPCPMAYTSPSMPRSGVIRRLPPRKLVALPMESTVMSMVCPGFENGGRSARTVTAATFFNCGFTLAGIVTPNLASMLRMLWIVNGAWLV